VIDKPANELTDEQYWSGSWSSHRTEFLPIDPHCAREREYHQFFTAAFTGRSGTLLEVGCGSSRWLPYFAKEFGFQVSGIDYSEIGCQQASALLERSGVTGVVLQRDALGENADLIERFDVVVSLGLVEHFADTAEVVRSLARYVRPNGLLVSTSPNMAGILGTAQRLLNPEIYAGHNPFTLEQLAAAHRHARLEVSNMLHIGSLDFHMLNLYGVTEQWKWLTYRALMRLSRIGWKAPFSLPRSRRWSSGIAVSAAKIK
jgi:2-polyprenyl-3-methyl-5-hydroxy-6-metoxy-1,4-benzoquinol methylase